MRRVTCVDKGNVLRSLAFFREIFLEVAADYPDIEAETLYSDACAYNLVIRPEHYDVLVMENMLGDLLSDLGGATAGGLGMCPSGNIGGEIRLFRGGSRLGPRHRRTGNREPFEPYPLRRAHARPHRGERGREPVRNQRVGRARGRGNSP